MNVINFHDTAFFNDDFSENSSLMLLNLLKRIGIKKVYCAGFDGFSSTGNFYDQSFEKYISYAEENASVKKILDNYLAIWKSNLLLLLFINNNLKLI